MVLPASGEISFNDINIEKGGTSGTQCDMLNLSTVNINTSNPSPDRPDEVAPHSIDEFYNYDHNAGVSGDLWGWGENSSGQVGNSSTIDLSSPVQVAAAITNWIEAGHTQTATVGTRASGEIYSWGNSNSQGLLGRGVAVSDISPIQIGVLADWETISGNHFAGSAAAPHFVGVKTDGTLWAWGNNAVGQLGDGTTTNRSSPVQIGALTTWVAAKAGDGFTVAVKSDGTLWTWGESLYSSLGNSQNTTDESSPIQVGALTNWTEKIATSGRNVVAVKSDGTLWTWGYNDWGENGDGTSRQTGGTGAENASPVQVGALTNWDKPFGGTLYAGCTKTDGTMWTWGYNANGNLGHGGTVSVSSPVQVGSLTDYSQGDAGGRQHTYFIRTNGTLWGCGRNDGGFLATGGTPGVDVCSPTQVGSATNWVKIFAGYDTHHALRS